jgi:hypothetical protein
MLFKKKCVFLRCVKSLSEAFLLYFSETLGFRQISEEYSNNKFIKISSLVVELLQADSRLKSHRQTKLMVTFRNYANEPKICYII